MGYSNIETRNVYKIPLVINIDTELFPRHFNQLYGAPSFYFILAFPADYLKSS